MALLAEHTDEQLLQLALDGNEDAFTALYRRRQGPVYRFALHMSGSPQVAEEVVQEVFIFLLQRGRDFDPERAALGAYSVWRGTELREARHGEELLGGDEHRSRGR